MKKGAPQGSTLDLPGWYAAVVPETRERIQQLRSEQAGPGPLFGEEVVMTLVSHMNHIYECYVYTALTLLGPVPQQMSGRLSPPTR